MRRALVVGIVMWGAVSVLFAPPVAVAQARSEESTFKAPRTPWGDPDLQGIWPGTESLGIPLQRDPKLGTRNELTDAEFAALAAQMQRRIDEMEAEFDLETADTSTAGQVGSPTSPQPHWQERGRPSRQASLIIDPPDGRMPPLTPPARARNQAIQAGRKSRGPADSYTDRSLYDRCVTRGVIGSILPVIYNNGNEIVQAPGYVVIRNEMIHESRIVPLDGRPYVGPAIRLWMGDSRGRWEGETLIVETRNLTARTGISQGGGNPHSEALVITERFTLTGADTLQYQVTLDDPQTWTRPWTISFPWKRDPNYHVFEYGCHEGNYAMRNLLSAARAEEQAQSAAPAR
jgi:hypothetical protein